MIFKNKCNYDMLVVGLGNPGEKYRQTRHNAGFAVTDKLCEKYNATLKRFKFKALICECVIGKKRILIAQPQTYMNLSGEAVAEICGFYKIPIEKVVIIFDDVSLPVGNIRIRCSGSHGGHNGMKDISEKMSTNDILRIKFGVGLKPHPDYDLKDWVLSRFKSEELETLQCAIDKAVAAIGEMAEGTVEKAMNKYSS